MAEFNYEDLEDLVLTIETEDGEELDLALLTIFEYEGKDYAVFTEDDDSEEGNVYIFSMLVGTDENDQPAINFAQVENDNLAEELFAIFQEIISADDDEDDSIIDMIPDTEEEDDDDDDDSKWDEFITKKLN